MGSIFKLCYQCNFKLPFNLYKKLYPTLKYHSISTKYSDLKSNSFIYATKPEKAHPKKTKYVEKNIKEENEDSPNNENKNDNNAFSQALLMFFGAAFAIFILSFATNMFKSREYHKDINHDTLSQYYNYSQNDSGDSNKRKSNEPFFANYNSFSPAYVSWNEFLSQMLAKGEVQQIVVKPEHELAIIQLFPGAVLNGKPAQSLIYLMTIPEVNTFEDKLRKAESHLGIKGPQNAVPVIYDHNEESGWLNLILVLIFAGLLLSVFRKNFRFKTTLGSDLFSQLTKAKFKLVDPLIGGAKGVRFSDVAGLHEAKQEIMEFVDYLKDPTRFQNLGAKIPKGALLTGPPGCGKTLLAKATATEANVPFLVMAGSEFVEMIGGLGAARVRDLFREARKRAPCIVYIDEIDALGRKRAEDSMGGGGGGGRTNIGGGSTGEQEQTLNQLLVEMDGINTQQNVIILASTNRVDILDAALLRPGRFDRHILVDLPTYVERVEIFKLSLQPLQLAEKSQKISEKETVDLKGNATIKANNDVMSESIKTSDNQSNEPQSSEKITNENEASKNEIKSQLIDEYAPILAAMTPGMSGADIANICNEAALYAARLGARGVSNTHLHYAFDRIMSKGAVLKRPGFLSPEERRSLAIHETGHALFVWLSQYLPAVLKVSIVPRVSESAVSGYTHLSSPYSSSDKTMYSREELFERLCQYLAGKVAENVILGQITTSGEGDLKKARALSYDMVRRFGMNERIGLVSFDLSAETGSGGEHMPKPYSKHLATKIDVEARNLIIKAYETTEKIMRENIDKVNLLTEALLNAESLDYDDIERLIGPPPFPKRKPSHLDNVLIIKGRQTPETVPESENKETLSVNPTNKNGENNGLKKPKNDNDIIYCIQ